MRITWYGHAAFLIETGGFANHTRPVPISRFGRIRADCRTSGHCGRQS